MMGMHGPGPGSGPGPMPGQMSVSMSGNFPPPRPMGPQFGMPPGNKVKASSSDKVRCVKSPKENGQKRVLRHSLNFVDAQKSSLNVDKINVVSFLLSFGCCFRDQE